MLDISFAIVNERMKLNGCCCSYNVFFSITGHSLGGLIARSALRLLIAPLEDQIPTSGTDRFVPAVGATHQTSLLRVLPQYKDIIHGFHPTSYLSISTPHLGCRRVVNKKGSWARQMWATAIEAIATTTLTGKELMLADGSWMSSRGSKKEPPPVLYEMALSDGPYMRALKPFIWDLLVGYASSAISSHNPHAAHAEFAYVDQMVEAEMKTDKVKKDGVGVVNGGLVEAGADSSCLRVHSISNYPVKTMLGEGDELPRSSPSSLQSDLAVFNATNAETLPVEIREILKSGFTNLGDTPRGTLHHKEETFIRPPPEGAKRVEIKRIDEKLVHPTPSKDKNPLENFFEVVGRILNATPHHHHVEAKKAKELIVSSSDVKSEEPRSFSNGSPVEQLPIQSELSQDDHSDLFWASDSEGELLFPTKLMKELQVATEGWRRVNLHLHMSSPFLMTAIHALMVGKPMPFSSARERDMARECAFLISRVLVCDFAEKLKEVGMRRWLTPIRNSKSPGY
ncbi:hypothetical protein BC829DRAFT_386709 [Chytridium lagenaria]|nr:hypothetical protein BC829DRAFT_386709 [Chytridium lagenaria]